MSGGAVQDRRAVPAASPAGSARQARLPPLVGVLAVLTACLWVYVLVRSVDVAFTTDESISYELVHGLTAVAKTANDHWLNTFLMRVAQSGLGDAEWALRLPNVLSLAIYGAASLWLVRSLRAPVARLVCFALLLGDPFLLEFFGLARGYGLSMAFSCAAVAVLFALPHRGSATRAVARFGLVGGLIAIGFYGNFSVLNFVLAMLAASLLDVLVEAARGRIAMSGRNWLALVAVGAAIGAALVPGVLRVEYLHAHHALFYGGNVGFVPDTIGRLVMTWGYVDVLRGVPLPGWALTISWIVAAVGLLALLYMVVRSAVDRRWHRMHLAAVVLLISVLAAFLERSILGTPWPIDRVALYFILALAAFLGLVLDDIGSRRLPGPASGLLTGAGLAVLLLAAFNVIRTANLTQALTWRADASSRAMTYRLMALESERPGRRRPLNFEVVYPRNFAFAYYRDHLGLSWLHIVIVPAAPSPIRYRSGGYAYDVPRGYAVKLPAGAYPAGQVPPDGTELWLQAPGTG